MINKGTDCIQTQPFAEEKPEHTTMFSKLNMCQKFSVRLQRVCRVFLK